MFFGHFPELIVVLVLGLVVFGPKRLPELGSSLGASIKEFRKATSELHGSIAGATTALPPEQHRDAALTGAGAIPSDTGYEAPASYAVKEQVRA